MDKPDAAMLLRLMYQPVMWAMRYLRRNGFHIKGLDEIDGHEWIEMTNGVNVLMMAIYTRKATAISGFIYILMGLD